MIKTVKRNKPFVIPYIILLMLCLIILCLFSKSSIHIAINQTHNRLLDVLFKYITVIGNGWFIVFICCVLLFVKFRYSIIIGLSGLLSGIFVQFLKRVFFEDIERPKKFFSGIYDLYFVPDTNIFSFYSFPSGHTTTAFSVFLCLTIFSKNKTMKFVYFTFAVLVGFSRIYLSQHFLIDALVGSIIGFTFTLIIYYFMNQILSSRFNNSLLNKL